MKIMEPSYQYFLELRKTEGGAFYSSIGNQIKLKKRRALVSQFYQSRDEQEEDVANRPTSIALNYRNLNKEEKGERKQKMRELLQEDEEDDLEEDS